jgi:hypothetical protein
MCEEIAAVKKVAPTLLRYSYAHPIRQRVCKFGWPIPKREQINTARFSAADLIIFVDLPKPKPGE